MHVSHIPILLSNRVRILTVYKSTVCSTRLYLKCRTSVNKADSCNSHQLWAASDFDASWWEVSRGNNQSILIKSRTTLVLFWPVHESWAENAHANTCLPTLINSHSTLVLVWSGHDSWENWRSCKHLLANSHATLVLVWSGHDSWENWRSCKLSLANSHQLSCNSNCSCLIGARELRKRSCNCKLSLANSHHVDNLFYHSSISVFWRKDSTWNKTFQWKLWIQWIRAAKSHGLPLSFQVFALISRSHGWSWKSHGFYGSIKMVLYAWISARPASLLGKQSKSDNMRSTVGQYCI